MSATAPAPPLTKNDKLFLWFLVIVLITLFAIALIGVVTYANPSTATLTLPTTVSGLTECPQGVSLGGTYNVVQIPTTLEVTIDEGKTSEVVQTMDLPGTSGSFAFPFDLLPGTTYTVTVLSTGSYTCNVVNSSGTVGEADVNNVGVTCTTISLDQPQLVTCVQTYSGDDKTTPVFQLVADDVIQPTVSPSTVRIFMNNFVDATHHPSNVVTNGHWMYTLREEEAIDYSIPRSYQVQVQVEQLFSQISNTVVVNPIQPFISDVTPTLDEVSGLWKVDGTLTGVYDDELTITLAPADAFTYNLSPGDYFWNDTTDSAFTEWPTFTTTRDESTFSFDSDYYHFLQAGEYNVWYTNPYTEARSHSSTPITITIG